MTSDFSRISETEYDKYTGNYTFYDKNKNIIISTYDIIFSLDIAYNPIFNIAIFDPPAEQDIKIKNIINSLFFPEKLNNSIQFIESNLLQINGKNYKIDILCDCDDEEEKELNEIFNNKNYNNIRENDLSGLLLFGCSICIRVKNTKKIILFVFDDFLDDLLLLGITGYLKDYRDEYGVVKHLINDNIEIYVVDLPKICVISELLINQKDILIRGKKIKEEGRDCLKLLTLRKFAYKKDREFVLPRNINLYKNKNVRNMMIYLNNLSDFTKSKILLDIQYFREDYYESYQVGFKRGYKKGRIKSLLIYFLDGIILDFKEEKIFEVEEEIVKEIWDKNKDKNVKNLKYEDFLTYLVEKNFKIIKELLNIIRIIIKMSKKISI